MGVLIDLEERFHLGVGVRPLDEQALESYIKAAAAALGIPLEEAWMPAIRANLAVSLRLASSVSDFELPDESEPAPVFEA